MEPMQYVDFMPECVDGGGIFSEAEYDRFDTLMARANEWLRRHANYRVLTCESVEMKQKTGSYVNPEKMSFYERGEAINRFVRALRLWLRPALAHEMNEPMQIGHLNVIPLNIEPAGVFSKAKFENLAATLERVNSMFRQRPLGGFIINIETQDMKYHTRLGTADPDECSWRETGKTGCYFIMVLRIFYAVGQPAYEEIGSADFVPRKLPGYGSDMESFGSTLGQAREWVVQQQGIRFFNVQSIDYKLKRNWGGESLDTHRTTYYEQGEGYTRYVRIVRVCYGKPSPDMGSPPPVPMPILNYKTFVPVLLSGGGFGSPDYETMSETWKRALAWMRAADVTQYLSAETVPIRLYSGRQHGDHEITYTRNHGDRNETWLYIIRVYINGAYTEPPPSSLPPVPVADDDCCTIL